MTLLKNDRLDSSSIITSLCKNSHNNKSLLRTVFHLSPYDINHGYNTRAFLSGIHGASKREKRVTRLSDQVLSIPVSESNRKSRCKVADEDVERYQAACLTVKKKQNGYEIKRIKVGKKIIDTWFLSPYPPEFCNQPLLYICEYCFKFTRTASTAGRHKAKCRVKHPPGDEIHSQEDISIFEVDGRKNKLYCLNLCLLTKSFLDHKTLFYDVEPFLFYIMTERDKFGFHHFVGYFSKEKESFLKYNVSCILILPIYQRKGYGQYLIDFSYLLTRQEKNTGSPEKPLSKLGALSYQRYWKYTVFKYLQRILQMSTVLVSIEEISMETGMTADDIITTLQSHEMIIFQDGQHVISIDEGCLQRELNEMDMKQMLQLDANRLHWKPFQLPQLTFSYDDTSDDDDAYSVSTAATK